jgi:metal-responsive CopG/Arc/MetJ family transcriptional regulator
MRKGSAEKQTRRNVTLPESAVTRLDRLKEVTGAASDSEVIRQALRVYDAISLADKDVILRDRETGKETAVLTI